MDAIEQVFEVLGRSGSRQYGGERVTQLAHALQCAALAERHGADSPLIAAALMHDLGHLLGEGDRGLAARGIDARHEDIAATWLAPWFGPETTEPVRLHVEAKRCLCRADPAYFDHLSAGSVTSLQVQGGIHSETEAAAFRARPHAEAAMLLRRWDDDAKDPHARTPGLEHFRPHLQAALRA